MTMPGDIRFNPGGSFLGGDLTASVNNGTPRRQYGCTECVLDALDAFHYSPTHVRNSCWVVLP